GPIARTLDSRAAKIREGLEFAEEAKAERQRMQTEVERLLGEARREATTTAERITQAAESAAAEIRDQALAQLRAEVAGMVVLAASRLLGREIDPAKHRELIEASLAEAGKELRQN